MLEWGLDPNQVSEEAFLKARDRFLQGRIERDPLGAPVPSAVRPARLAVAEFVADQRDGSAV
jgi:hypothetical protein